MPREVALTVRVAAPDDMPPSEVARLVQAVIESGEAEAEETPADWDGDDGRLVNSLGPIVVDAQAARDDAELDAWVALVYSRAAAVDPEGSYVWDGVAAGFFIGRGAPPDEAHRLAALARVRGVI